MRQFCVPHFLRPLGDTESCPLPAPRRLGSPRSSHQTENTLELLEVRANYSHQQRGTLSKSTSTGVTCSNTMAMGRLRSVQRHLHCRELLHYQPLHTYPGALAALVRLE